MVSAQIARRGVSDPAVLAAIQRVPRHQFVPSNEDLSAYEDRALSISDRQTISRPYMVAVMTELLRLTSGSRVLDVGIGSGYQAAVLASIGRKVVSIERRPALADAAGGRLVMPVGSPELQDLMLIARVGEGFTEVSGETCMFVLLVGRYGCEERSV